MLCEWKSLCVNMETFLWTTLVCFFSGICCFENLSKRNTTVLELSSTYVGHGVTLANDGDLALKEWYCSHTDPNRPKAWLQVDLGQPFSISNVKIYYRAEDSWQQYRFRQFYLDVSEFPATTSNTSQRTRCYTDNTTAPHLPPNIIDMPCQQTARYVIVETTYDAPEDDPISGAMLEICEIEIYGCETGRYGEDCTPCWGCQSCDIKSGLCDCPDTCNNQICNKSSGQCIFGCQSGYWDFKCSSSCSENCLNRNCSITNGTCDTCISGRYGDTCDKMCSPGCVSQSCDRQSGACSDGCRPYWAGKYCDTCDSSHYGPTCSETCSINCNNGCRPDNGDCIDCVEGMFGSKCNKTCSTGCMYGCDQFTGRCTCKQGSQNDSCVECNPDYYGVLCDKQCSPNCNRGTCFANNGTCDSGCKCNNITKLNVQDCPDICNNQICDKLNGYCLFGCQTGYWDFNCSSSCSENCLNRNCSFSNGTCDTCIRGRYGDTCDKMCSTGCVSQSCDRQSGACSDGCRPYWAGKYCDTCNSYRYGPTCLDTCSINCNNGCRPDNGDCYDCVEGMFGIKCNKTCGPGCMTGCDQITGHCTCKQGWQNDTCVECSPDYYGVFCDKQCSPNCNRGTCFGNNGTCDRGCKCNIIKELNAQVQHLQNINNNHILYAVSVLFCLSLMINMFLSIRYFKNNTCKCKKELSKQHEKKSRASTNDDNPDQFIYDCAEMETDYQNLSELRRSQHHYEQFG